MKENTKPQILYIDDETDNLLVFRSSFRRHYQVFTANSGEEGLEIVKQNNISVIITDQRMPGMTGVEFLKHLPDETLAIRMILTGYSDVSAIIEAINSGKVYRYITKPWEYDELKMSIDNAIEAHSLRKKNRELIDKLQEHNEQLEQKVEERTAKLATALEDLEELNATKDKFFSIVAHDLRSPVSSLLGFSSMLADHGDKLKPDEISSLAKDLNLSVRNTLTLIENLLVWARQQMNRIKHNPELLNIASLIEEAAGPYKLQARTKEIQLDIEIEDDTCAAFVDKEQIALVIRNLVTNALKFTKGGGHVRLKASCTEDKIMISVTDTGVGMATEQLKKLFSIGHNQSTKGTQGEKGTGLGLILSKEFVEKNGGQLKVESRVDEGSTFTITLPTSAEGVKS